MRYTSTLIFGALLLVVPSVATAGWEKQCETITKLEDVRIPGGIFQRPVTETICRDVWIPEPDETEDAKRVPEPDQTEAAKKQIELMAAMVKLCKELEMELEPCMAYLSKISAGGQK